MFETKEPFDSSSVAQGPVRAVEVGVDGDRSAATLSEVRPRLERYLIQQVRDELSDRLETSLISRLQPPESERSVANYSATNRPWNYTVELLRSQPLLQATDGLPDERLGERRTWGAASGLGGGDAAADIHSITNDPQSQGSVLILGGPGTGKTTVLVDLATELLKDIDRSSAPIPVLLDLSTWGIQPQPMTKWLEAALVDKYNLPPAVASQWIRKRRVVPLLDGLDGVERAFRAACVQALNRWVEKLATVGGGCYPILTCRAADYDALSVPVNVSAVVTLEELTELQVASVLKAVNASYLNYYLLRNPALATLVRSPASLCMLALVARNSASTVERVLVSQHPERSLVQMYVRDSSNRMWRHSPVLVQRWLTWIARQMQVTSQSEFDVDNLHPPVSLRHVVLLAQYYGSVALAFGAIGGLLGWMCGGWSGGLGVALLFALVGVGSELVPNFRSRFMVPRWQRSGQLDWHQLSRVVVLYIPIIVLSAVFAVSFGVGLRVGLGVVLLGAAMFALSGWMVGDLGGRLTGWLFGSNNWLRGGLGELLKYRLLRLTLCWSGRTPWHYERFLDECVSVQLMQKSGDRYRFVHSALQDYFTPSN